MKRNLEEFKINKFKKGDRVLVFSGDTYKNGVCLEVKENDLISITLDEDTNEKNDSNYSKYLVKLENQYMIYDVHDWLISLGLSDFLSLFNEQEYDSMEVIQSLNETDIDVLVKHIKCNSQQAKKIIKDLQISHENTQTCHLVIMEAVVAPFNVTYFAVIFNMQRKFTQNWHKIGNRVWNAEGIILLRIILMVSGRSSETAKAHRG
eukprot:TRINITY_DN420_c0_g1_i1.p1 TRINITY_DN420_c0_g1~~TRINITY_DN420_c0_g1_i1.p1  ORF type:complete len:206 (-),score=39.34 TRINITY_DN420_c0_g1_i1:2-619(-)